MVITGAARGLGYALAETYAAAGAKVIATTRTEPEDSKLATFATTVRGFDVTRDETMTLLLEEIGQLPTDILINNAGVFGPSEQSIQGVDLSLCAEAFAVNVLGTLRVIQHMLPSLLKSGAPKVIAITSRSGSMANQEWSRMIYRASKAALNKATQCIAGEFASQNIIFAAIAPGWVRTNMGGPNALLEPSESAEGLVKVIHGLEKSDSGKFLDYTGKELPW